MNPTETDNLLALADLISAYHEGRLDPQQTAELKERLAADASFQLLLDSFNDKNKVLTDLKVMDGFDTEQSLAMLHKKHGTPKSFRLWPRIAVAAALFAIVFGIWFYNNDRGVLKQVQDDVAYKNDITPGKNTATLSYNGRSVPLSEAKTGVKFDNDKLTYNDGSPLSPKGEALPGGERMITATTPRGGTYEFVLQDGTRVWLNADSKLEFYPSYKNKTQRIVKLEGEGYFEVAKDKAHPFVVESAGQKVEVLGTHFNINAYKDEKSIKTTLLEGKVKVNDAILKPNQQATLAGVAINIKNVDASAAIDWKNGEFICANEPLSAIMRKVERWYNVEVIYTSDDLKNRTFDGAFSRYDNVSRILKTIEFAGTVKFRLEGRKVFVTK